MRSSFAKLRWWAGVCAALLLAGAAVALSGAAVQSISGGQLQQPMPTVPSSPPGFGEQPNPADPMQRQQQERMEKARNVDRQKQLERDTDKLLSLAKELKEEVNKSNKDTLSIDVVKKAAEIEKLAKSVKDRMRG
jgi:hypothetical protein